MKALIVDDDKLICESIFETLNKVYHIKRVDYCYNGRDAQEMISNEFYDIIFVDINIPLINGLQLMKFIQERSKESIMIMTSAKFTSQTAQIASDFHVEEVLLKPFDMQKITEVVNHIINNHPKIAS